MIKLDNWAIVFKDDRLRLSGVVTGHPQHDDGKEIVTSRIVAADGKTVKTRSGSLYQLGDPAPGFVEYINECKSALQWDEPLALYKIVEKLELDPLRIN